MEPAAHWRTSRHLVDLRRVRIMGVVNVTPDSFSDGGRLADANAAVAHCEQLLRDGADILDIGGESSRPGARQVSLQEEADRVLPVIDAALRLGCPVSLDTTKPELMRLALQMGVDIVNDINALQSPGAIDAVASHGSCGVVLMHMLGKPETMQEQIRYSDVVADVRTFLQGRADALTCRNVLRSVSCSTRESVSARVWKTTSSCWRGSVNCSVRVTRCSWDGRASPRSGR